MFTAAADALAAAVVDLRKQRNMTQRGLAAAVGREQNYIARIEQGQRRVDLIEWIVLCRACKVDPIEQISAMLRQVAPLVPQRKAHSK